jgi:uroporphyrinogen-III decarboxylase
MNKDSATWEVLVTSREIIKRAVEFRSPPRVGLIFPEMSDVDYVFDFFQKDANGVDLWGSKWTVHPDYPSTGYVQEHPLSTVSAMEAWRPPDAGHFATMTEASLTARLPGLARADKYRIVALSSGLWERLQYLRGMEQVMLDFVEHPDAVHSLLRRLTDTWLAYIERLTPFAAEIDALFMFDDWGTQTAAMISPAMWREFFLPEYRRLTAACHVKGMHFWLHSCGKVTELLSGFVEAGIDVVNPYQSGTCGYEEVAERFCGKISFATTVDIQTTLKTGPVEAIRAECARLARWGSERGGLIIRSYGYDIAPAHEEAVLEYFLSHPLAENTGKDGGSRP